MQYIADFHIHSKHSRATSSKMDLENISLWAKKKGINIISCGDFTHPKWFKELKEKLVLNENGLYSLKSNDHGINFILTTEISCIYSKGGKCRRLHVLVFAPSLEVVEQINLALGKIGNLKADGRPILGLDAKRLAEIVFSISEDCMIIPAHAWTPWFAVFGSKSGFDSLEECFEELTPKICAIETGLSSDPAMNWRLKQLDNITLISNSDAHSLEKLGREANVFDLDADLRGQDADRMRTKNDKKNLYKEIVRILREKDKKRFLYTIEFFPEEGKYHYDGCAKCGVRMSPAETKKNAGVCPKCKKQPTIGVLSRVDDLADRKDGEAPNNAIPFKNLIPLVEIIAASVNKKVGTKTVAAEYDNLINIFQNEFNILLNVAIEDIQKKSSAIIAEGIKRVREGKLIIEPGYDGIFGTIKIFDDKEIRAFEQKKLF